MRKVGRSPRVSAQSLARAWAVREERKVFELWFLSALRQNELVAWKSRVLGTCISYIQGENNERERFGIQLKYGAFETVANLINFPINVYANSLRLGAQLIYERHHNSQEVDRELALDI